MIPVNLFAALADPTRCRVLEMLHERPMPVHELAAAFSISRPAISRHLRVLREASLVREEKQGRENLYSLQRQQLRPMAEWLDRHRHRQRRTVTLVPPAVPTPVVQMEFEL